MTRSVALFQWLKMVDITIVNGGYFMVYKPTNISGGPYPVQTMAIEIVDIPNKHGDFPVRYVNIYLTRIQKVNPYGGFLKGFSVEYLWNIYKMGYDLNIYLNNSKHLGSL